MVCVKEIFKDLFEAPFFVDIKETSALRIVIFSLSVLLLKL